MIYASGVVTILTKSGEKLPIRRLKAKMITLEVIEEIIPAEHNEWTGKVIGKFTAILPRSFECRSLEDYTGKVKPFLQQSIGSLIVSVQVSHLNYLSEQAIQRIRKK